MSSRKSIAITLTPELKRFIDDRVATGRYETASEVVREGLRMLESQESLRLAEIELIRRQLNEGASQADSGELLTPAQVRRQLSKQKARFAHAREVSRS